MHSLSHIFAASLLLLILPTFLPINLTEDSPRSLFAIVCLPSDGPPGPCENPLQLHVGLAVPAGAGRLGSERGRRPGLSQTRRAEAELGPHLRDPWRPAAALGTRGSGQGAGQDGVAEGGGRPTEGFTLFPVDSFGSGRVGRMMLLVLTAR